MQPITPIDEGKNYHEAMYARSVATTFRNLSFGNTDSLGTMQVDNMSGYWWQGNTGTSTNIFTIAHNLGRVPVGYLVMSKSAPCDVAFVSSDTTNITLDATANNVNLSIFILG